MPANDDELPMSVILDENGSYGASILSGREIGNLGRPVTLNKSVLKRHAAYLGGSGSGKTTLALSLIEQLLLRGIPAVMIDRKGDLASYANPEVWRANENDTPDRRARTRKARRRHRCRRLYAGTGFGAADLDHASAQWHQ